MSAHFKWAIAAIVVLLGAGVVGVLLMSVVNNAFQPVIQCAPSSVASKPPASLVSASDYMALGDYEFDRGNCDGAVAAYSRAIALNPDFAEAYNNRAYAYMTQKDYTHALRDLDRAIALRPTYVNALMNRGDIHNYYYDINYDLAIADYDRVIALGAPNTSVCGHRMLAVNHGWNANMVMDVFTHMDPTGCLPESTGY